MRENHIKVLKSRTWLNEILIKSELPSPYALESYFSPSCLRNESEEGRKRTSRWQKYKRGETLPSKRTVAAVEAHFPGTALWFHTPLWRLIGEEEMHLHDIADVIGTARPHLAKHVKSRCNALARPMTVNSLWRQGDLEALSALLAVVRHAEITRNLAQYVEASWASLNLAIFISSTTALSAIQEEFLDTIWDRFFRRLQALPTSYVDGWTKEQSLAGVQRIVEAATCDGRVKDRRDLAQLAFWMASIFPLFVVPAKSCLASALDRYEAAASTGKRYSANSMNLIQKSCFYMLRDQQERQGEPIDRIALAENTFFQDPAYNNL